MYREVYLVVVIDFFKNYYEDVDCLLSLMILVRVLTELTERFSMANLRMRYTSIVQYACKLAIFVSIMIIML